MQTSSSTTAPHVCAFAYRDTGKERDTESGNDYFGARYYASGMGRFMSPDSSTDPDPIPFADLEDPQTLNRYSYTSNNPLSKSDSDGHFICNCPVEPNYTELWSNGGRPDLQEFILGDGGQITYPPISLCHRGTWPRNRLRGS